MLARSVGYFPIAGKSKPKPAPDGEAEIARMRGEMMRVFTESEWQQRENPTAHPLLMLAAQNKAEDMLRWRYFAHMSQTGIMPNNNVLLTGYPLPAWYDRHANNVESIGLNYNTPQDLFAAWMTSETHARHVTGSHSFFKNQECFGVGYIKGPEDSGAYYVLVSAPCPPGGVFAGRARGMANG
jgi:hypothetical protein